MMQIKLISFGGQLPVRAHYNDAGADVFANADIEIYPHEIRKVPLGIGLELPDGFVAFVLPRSGMSANSGITTEVVPIDSGYRGEIHAIVYNANDNKRVITKGTKIAQLVIVPVIIASFFIDEQLKRDTNAFGSTGDASQAIVLPDGKVPDYLLGYKISGGK
jgi:dUTP pyrophosphatase